ncbi:uncharacterized protein LOC116607446 [Nematostella vectensis]|uniref:uncharacterized protein LOC116607446 n=1 Tax=Nematostella vectensis TaxID=45351 RepID=UPI0020773058|nr:uncharacterized protein LOC116607446 [Nematostella vectensis]
MEQFIFFVVFLGAIYGQQQSQAKEDRDDFQKQATFSAIEGFELPRGVYANMKVAHAFECSSACLSDARCRSANYHKNYNPMNLCELSSVAVIEKTELAVNENVTYYKRSFSDVCANCKNGARCTRIDNLQGYECHCPPFNTGMRCEGWTVNISSCKDILNKTSYRTNMAYTFTVGSEETSVYCHMSSICGSGGWTLVMKTDGRQNTFQYSSKYWSDKLAYNPEAGLTGLDGDETKLSTYWSVPFDQICLGMEVGDKIKWLTLDYPSASLYDVIADGNFKNLSMSRDDWLGLIEGSQLQANCDQNGFNARRVRIGIIGNQENHCNSPDSFVGIGSNHVSVSVGNTCVLGCQSNRPANGYILIR